MERGGAYESGEGEGGLGVEGVEDRRRSRSRISVVMGVRLVGGTRRAWRPVVWRQMRLRAAPRRAPTAVPMGAAAVAVGGRCEEGVATGGEEHADAGCVPRVGKRRVGKWLRRRKPCPRKPRAQAATARAAAVVTAVGMQRGVGAVSRERRSDGSIRGVRMVCGEVGREVRRPTEGRRRRHRRPAVELTADPIRARPVGAAVGAVEGPLRDAAARRAGVERWGQLRVGGGGQGR